MNLGSTTFSVSHLKRILDAVRGARPLPPTPLATFAAVQDLHVSQCASGIPISIEFAIIQWLSERIQAGLDHQRLHLGIEPLSPDRPEARQVALKQFQQDFGQNSLELQAWSLLYYHYVRVDLDLGWQQIESLVHQDDRTLRRRLDRGLKRLVAWLLESEDQVRRVQMKQVLHQRLPALARQPLVGREAIIQQVCHLLLSEDGQPVALVGPGGIGKTAVAIVATHLLIDSLNLDQVVWVNFGNLDGSLHPLAYVAAALSLSEPELRLYTARHRVLLVFDEADSLVDPSLGLPGLKTLCEGLGNVRLLLTCRYRDPAGCAVIKLGELSAQEARMLVNSLLPEASQIGDSRWQVIWNQAGGNPLALQVAASLVRTLPRASLSKAHPLAGLASQQMLLEMLYEKAWTRLKPVAQTIWLTTWLLPADVLHPEIIQWVTGCDLTTFSAGVQELVGHFLLDYAAENDTYCLHSVARAFLHARIQATPELLPAIHSAVEHISAIVMGAANGPQLVRRLLQLADMLSLAPGEQVCLFETVWPVICRRGNWTIWKPVIEGLIAESDQCDAWVRRLSLRLGVICRWMSRFDESERYLQAGLNPSVQPEDPDDDDRDSIQALVELAVCYRSQGRLASASETLRLAIERAERQRDSLLCDRCLLEMAQVALDEQKPDRVFAYLESCISSARTKALTSDAHLLTGDYAKALEAAHQALALSMPDRPNHARARALLGRCLLASGRLDEAEDYLALSLELLNQNQDTAGWARAASALARVYYSQGNPDRAIELLDDVVMIQQSLQDRIGLSSTLQIWIEVHVALANRLLANGQDDKATALVVHVEQVESEWKSLVESWKH